MERHLFVTGTYCRASFTPAPVADVAGFVKIDNFFGDISRVIGDPFQGLGDNQRPELSRMAHFGLAIFRDLAGKACEHRLPILLHY